uniref:NADH-ubiquinone oxidoreductase chain 1 n=1 Tax=Scutopus ventrolineatus TaxID=52922 RepID=A0A096XEB6_SCUVE|nr:NADH dehydrogenase subunit 1 [Scutopus ventrolineatus]AHI45702.1 NADH dehydrogenase subunit 1 [Scutopus ventrolineatus]
MVGCFSFIITFICVLVAVAFFTLLERKGLGYFAERKGPNKVSVMGLFQPMADAVKLFTKEFNIPMQSNFMVFSLGPSLNILLMLLLWMCIPMYYSSMFFNLGILGFLCVSSVFVYTLLMAGWSSYSKFALLGALRSMAQTISYEISMVFILLMPVVIYMSLNFGIIIIGTYSVVFMGLPMCFMWMVSCLAETNRAPLDFAEGESELVSGFNVEYSGGGFALVFMAEYGSILFMSILTAILFLGGFVVFGFQLVESLTIKAMIVCFLFVWLRAAYPRLRYNTLMDITWKFFLPVAISIVLLCILGVLMM